MTDLEALVGLNTADIGLKRYKRLLEYFDKPQKIIQAPLEKLTQVEGIGERLALNIISIKKEALEKEFKAIEKFGLKVVTWDDPEYPTSLKQIYDPPLLLYVKGRLQEKDKFSLAIVGSRRASFYGMTCAEKFASELVEFGFTIVSGMARGIDTAAHKGALKAKGRTIAVMGSGFGNVYPPDNRGLVEKIAENGAVISEFPISTEPLPQNFPRRNRIISGLSLGVLVVEASRNSGALITADFALEQGREVFSLPGRIDSQNSSGTNQLIKQGAKLVSSVEDILEELNVEIEIDKKERPPHSYIPGLDKEEKMLYNSLSAKPTTLDEIIAALPDQKVPKVMNLLLKLEMKKIIRQLPGKRFVRLV